MAFHHPLCPPSLTYIAAILYTARHSVSGIAAQTVKYNGRTHCPPCWGVCCVLSLNVTLNTSETFSSQGDEGHIPKWLYTVLVYLMSAYLFSQDPECVLWRVQYLRVVSYYFSQSCLIVDPFFFIHFLYFAHLLPIFN